jgi:hypothetical protein
MESNTYDFNKNGQNSGVSIEFRNLVSPIPYNSFTVTKYDCSPLNPEFTGYAPQILINKITFAKTVMTSYTGVVTLDLSNYAKNIKLNNPKAFVRSTIDSGVFTEVPVEYESAFNKLTFNVSGSGLGTAEICIGDYFDKQPTVGTKLISPRDNSTLNKMKDIKFVWSPNGRYDRSTLRIYKNVDSNYELIKQIDSVKPTNYTVKISELPVHDNYSWTVESFNEYGSGSINRFNFSIKDPFIKMLSPNGGEKLIRDSISYVVKWDDNLDDLVRIELLDNDKFVAKIADSLQSQLNNIKWTIPASVPTGANYKIRISSLKDSLMITQSANPFEIISKTSDIRDEQLATEYELVVSPNPVKDFVNITLHSANDENIEIAVLNISGEMIYSVSNYLVSGKNEIPIDVSSWITGTYLMKFKTDKGTFTGRFIKID